MKELKANKITDSQFVNQVKIEFTWKISVIVRVQVPASSEIVIFLSFRRNLFRNVLKSKRFLRERDETLTITEVLHSPQNQSQPGVGPEF